MRKSTREQQESTASELFEDIKQLKLIALGAGVVTCQGCGSAVREGGCLTAYAFRPAESRLIRLGHVRCMECEPPRVGTLGVRELLVRGRVGHCRDQAMQSSWPVLVAPRVRAVSPLATKQYLTVPTNVDPQSPPVEPDTTPTTPANVSVTAAVRRR